MKQHILISMALLALASCSAPHANDTLTQAEASIAAGDTLMARKCVIELSDTADYELTPSQLCRQALIYARLRELCDNPYDMASAALCYRKALSISPDSVKAFAETLSVGDLASLRIIHDVNHAIENYGENFMLHEDFEIPVDSLLDEHEIAPDENN